MKLHVIGSGSCLFRQEDRSPASYILETEHHNILVDTGTGIVDNIVSSDIAVSDIDVVINTHRHPDHVSDLIPIIQNKVVESLYYSDNEKDIAIYGPDGHEEYVENRVRAEMDDSLEDLNENFPFDIEVTDIEKGFELESLDVEVREVEHGSDNFPCLAVKIGSENKSVVFTGDTDYFEELADFSEGSDLLITDCSMPDSKKADGHMTPSGCLRLAEEAGAEKLLLSHLYPDMDDEEVPEDVEYAGEVVTAEDLLIIGI